MTDKNKKKPFIKKFKVGKHNYIYDVNSNEILRVDRIYYDLIDEIGNEHTNHILEKFKDIYKRHDILETLKTLRELNQERGYFSFQRPVIFSGIKSEKEIMKILSTQLSQLILEISENCSQECKYCLFSGRYFHNRTHSRKDMHVDIVTKAVDFFVKRTGDTKNRNYPPAITFYGGEPLLRFDLIRHVVESTKKSGCFDKFYYSFTTNGIHLDEEIIEYLVKNNISILVSLDGPKVIHDRYRVLKNGAGTFDLVLANLKRIKKISPHYFSNNISFSAVLCPPYNLKAINSFFFARKFFEPFRDKIRFSFVDVYGTTFFRDFHLEEEKERFPFEMNKLRKRYEKKIMMGKEERLNLEGRLLFNDYYNIAYRPIMKMSEYLSPRGSCFPGSRRLFVDVTGKFYMCEKVGSNYPIGDIDNGFYPGEILKFYERYDRFFQDCGNCWALRMCTKCFNSIRKGAEFDLDRKKMFCQKQIKSIEENLISYCKIIEQNPSAFKFYEKVKII